MKVEETKSSSSSSFTDFSFHLLRSSCYLSNYSLMEHDKDYNHISIYSVILPSVQNGPKVTHNFFVSATFSSRNLHFPYTFQQFIELTMSRFLYLDHSLLLHISVLQNLSSIKVMSLRKRK